MAQTPLTFADTVAWDGEYDVIVAGFGAAGTTAAINAAKDGASVLVVEKAPEGHDGGNTRYCGQMFAYGNKDPEATYSYYRALGGDHEVPEAMLRVYTEGIAFMVDKLVNDYGANPDTITDQTFTPVQASSSPEYPEFPGSDKIGLWSIMPETSNGALLQLLRDRVTERSDKIDVWYDSPATSLIQDPQSGTIVGVVVQREGKSVNLRATNGVVLATGGFENNPEMVETFLGLSRSAALGGLYNTGDGVRMAMDVGADLWHMEVYEGIAIMGGLTFAVPEGERASLSAAYPPMWMGSSLLVSGTGSRYLNESGANRHGHMDYAGTWLNPKRPARSFLVMDQAQYDQVTAMQLIPTELTDVVSTADTIEALAEKTGMVPATLTATVSAFNGYAETGVDPQFGRNAATMKPLGEGPYYAVEMIQMLLNTQGGPRRNENAEILDTLGQPIPHLYSAGELGAITSLQYQGGGNISECIIFGEIAGKNAAAVKDALPTYQVEKATSNLVFTPGAVSDLVDTTDDVTLGENEYLGQGEGMSGTIQVKLTMAGDKIGAVEVLKCTDTEGICEPALEKIPGAIVAANTPEVDVVSGASMTSRGIMDAVKDAMSKVK